MIKVTIPDKKAKEDILSYTKIYKTKIVDINTKYVKKEKIIIEDVKKAFSYAKKISEKDDLLLVTGSFYVVAEVVG